MKLHFAADGIYYRRPQPINTAICSAHVQQYIYTLMEREKEECKSQRENHGFFLTTCFLVTTEAVPVKSH